VLGETVAEHRHQIGAGENGGSRQAGRAVSDAPSKTTRAEPIIDKAGVFAANIELRYAASRISRTSSRTRRKFACGMRHMVRYVFRKGRQLSQLFIGQT
jgi:hypothetical protein